MKNRIRWKWGLMACLIAVTLLLSNIGNPNSELFSKMDVQYRIMDAVNQTAAIFGVGFIIALILALFGKKAKGYWPEVINMLPSGVIIMCLVLLAVYFGIH